MDRVFAAVARNGRFLLLAGLGAGLLLPGLAAVLERFIPQMIGALLFLNAFRSGVRPMARDLRAPAATAGLVLALQLGLLLLVLGGLRAGGIEVTGFALAAVLMMSAPALVGSPNFVAMSGHDPAEALALLYVGTAIFPLTALAVLAALPGVPVAVALKTTAVLAAAILGIALAGITARRALGRRAEARTVEPACDAATALLLSVVVVGLMAEVGALLTQDPWRVLRWTAAVVALNFGLQIGALALFRGLGLKGAVAASVMAGNRNVALFLIALPEEVRGAVMLFVGCYQIPMYLTPLVLRRLHRPPDAGGR